MAGLFATTARPALLAAARSGRLRQGVQRLGATRAVVRRFVPGESCADALGCVAALRASGRLVSIDYLGEDITDITDITATVAAYLQLLDALGRQPDGADTAPVPPLEISVKLSALGHALGTDGAKIALENAHTICERAAEVGVWVTVDAEDHTTTDSTLAVVSELRAEFGWLGLAL